jgi:tetratricopeptide (TPR) repeat protein
MHRTINIVTFLALFISVCANAQYKLYESGLAKYNEKDYYEAISLLSDFLTKPQHDKKFDVDAYYWRGLAAFKLNNFADAAEDLKRAQELNYSNKGNLHWFLAKCYDKTNANNEALVEYGNALRILGSDKTKEAQILFERSLVYSKIGKLSEAQQDVQIAAAVDPNNTLYKDELAKLSVDRSRSTIVEKNASLKPTTVADKKNDKPVQKKPEEQKQQPVVLQPTNSEPAPVLAKQNQTVKEETRQTLKQPNNQPPHVTNKSDTPKETPVQKPETKPVVQQPVAAQVEPTLAELYADEKRFALVIGNSAYSKQVGVLKNPVNDATDFAKTLKEVGFDVTLITDASYGKIRAEMMKFRDKLNQGEKDKTVGLFFYAGHGLQHDNENYIVPVDAELEYEDDISRYCFPIQRMVLAQMEQSNSRMNIVVLDACRNNPFPAIHRGIGESNGLGEMKKARGAFIAYATSPGSVASDGSGRNGLYTQELIKAMSKPGRTIEQVFKDVRGNVLRQSGDKQNPWENSNIIGDFYFKFN